MRKRFFLVVLVFFLLLATTANQHVQNTAALLGQAEVLGCIPLWQLYNILPASIFSAGAAAAALGIGAEFWRALLPLCGMKQAPKVPLNRMADAGLWCGWVTLAACITALGCVFPLSITSDSGMYHTDNYLLLLQIAAGVMLLCRLLALGLREKAALPLVLLCTATALVCGQFWWHGQAIGFLSTTLALPWGVLLLWQAGKLPRTHITLSLAAAAIAVYGLSFAPTISHYTPGGDAAPYTALCGGVAVAVFLLLLVLYATGLKRQIWMQRLAGVLLLLGSSIPYWANIVAPAMGQTEALLPLSLACWGVLQLCLCGLFCMRLWVSSSQNAPKKQEN